MRKSSKYLFLFFLILLAACIKEEHYKDIEEINGIGLPIEINIRTKILNVHNPYFKSFNEETNVLKLYNIKETPALVENDVLVIGLDTSGVIRKILKIIDIESDPIEIVTENATMEDIFINAEFKLSTELIKPSSSFKSANIFTNQNTEALTDENGFIHPVQIIYHKKNGGKIIKSALLDGKNMNNNIVDGDFVFGQTLYTKRDLGGFSFYRGDNIQLSIDSGYIEFSPVFKFEFKFTPPKIDISKLKIDKGELHKLKFYSDKTKFDFMTSIKLEAEGEYNTDKEPKTLLKDIVKVSFVFAIGPVPVYMDINCDLLSNCNIDLKGQLTASAGFQSTHYVTLGAEYNKSTGWEKINDYQSVNKVIPLQYEGIVQFGSRFEIYPRFEVIFYKVLGPYLEVAPYLNTECTVYTKNGITPWNANIDLGIDLRSGVDIKFLNNDPSFPDFPITKWQLYAAPYKLSMVSGSGQTQITGKQLEFPLSVKVEDDKNNPLPLVPVFFSSTNGGAFEKKVIETNEKGLASAIFTSPSKTGEGEVKAIIKNGKEEQIDETVVFKYSVMEGEQPKFDLPLVINTTQKTATIKCRMTNPGDVTIAELGLIYGENQNLESNITELKSDNPVSTDAYEIKITGLIHGTTYYVRAYAKDKNEKIYPGPIFPFETEFEKPKVEILNVIDIQERAVLAKGRITDNGGGQISERGFVYNQSGNPTIENGGTSYPAKKEDDSGYFEVEILGLKPDNKYFIEAYVITDIYTAYSDSDKYFTTDKPDEPSNRPKVETLSYSNVSKTAVKVKGKITDIGSSDIKRAGFVWGKNDEFKDTIEVTVQGLKDEEFEGILEPLKEGKTYKYFAFAENENGRSEITNTEKIDFNPDEDPPVEPIVKTVPVGEVKETTAVLKGDIESNGNSEIIKYGFYISKTKGFADGSGDDVLESGNIMGGYSITKLDLDPGTTYYYKAYAKNKAGKKNYGEEEGFKTSDNGGGRNDPIPPEVRTVPIAEKGEKGENYAILWGEIENDGGADIEGKGIKLKYPNGNTEPKEYEIDDGNKFAFYFKDLDPGTYEYQAYAKNYDNNEIGYGGWESFTIEPPTKEITCPIVDKWTGHIKKVSLRYNRPNDFPDDYAIKAGEVSGGLGVYRGWAIFDISNIESNAKIEKIVLKLRCDETLDGKNSTLFVTKLNKDPRLANSSAEWKEVYNAINETVYAQEALYDNTKDNYDIKLSSAIQDLQKAIFLHENTFFIGFRESTENKKRIMIGGYGWDPPKLEITYTLQ